ncbi:Os03g0726500 protein, related [Neospora caninum Liverpool]|uniref:Os03g0726500 protein, related n=1 Tax=Neospora caninum (strain Liverpool) TaxID=572307 RepID=F0VCV0_NEOCL|nr:Os03g0726500 protein, related [Neospora caninum Liverpool]CBZ51465.1 Os03g0726500 protein, related [Neospora caninum Liverpool]|eukprot:XP_003881498.1 Os03g0726500 protein, related [Neospora caninum Liverpool]
MSWVVPSVASAPSAALWAKTRGDWSGEEITPSVDLSWPHHLDKYFDKVGFLYVTASGVFGPPEIHEIAAKSDTVAAVSSGARLRVKHRQSLHRVWNSSDEEPLHLTIGVRLQQEAIRVRLQQEAIRVGLQQEAIRVGLQQEAIPVGLQQETPRNTVGLYRSLSTDDPLLVLNTGSPVRKLSGLVDERRTLSELNNGPTIVCIVLIAIVGAVSVTAGTGGGAIFVPLMQLIMHFNTFEATATSQCLMTGSALAGLCLNFVRRNPVVDMPLIDMDMVLLLGPMQMCGSSVGVIVNRVLPAWLITVLLVVCLLYETVRLMRRLRDKQREAKKVTQLTASEHAHKETCGEIGAAVPMEEPASAGDREFPAQKVAGDDEKQGGNETKRELQNSGKKEGEECEDQGVRVSSDDGKFAPEEPQDREQATVDYGSSHINRKRGRSTIKYQWKRHELTKWSMLLAVWIINLTITFIKGGKHSTFHIGAMAVSKGSDAARQRHF